MFLMSAIRMLLAAGGDGARHNSRRMAQAELEQKVGARAELGI